LHDSRSPISSVACDHRMVSPISSGSGFRVAPPSDLLNHLERLNHFGVRVYGVKGVSGFGFRDFGFHISDFGVSGVRSRVSGFWVSDFGFRVSEFGMHRGMRDEVLVLVNVNLQDLVPVGGFGLEA
jgi:hypothetical protein